MAKRDELIRAYIEALEIAPLIVLALPTGRPTRIASEPEKRLQVFDALYFTKPQHAELVLSRAIADLDAIDACKPQGWIDLDAQEVREVLANSAAQVGASFRSMAEIERDAGAAVDGIVASVEGARRSGGIAQVNAAYKAYRQAQLARAEPAISYTTHLANFTRNLVVLAARNSGNKFQPRTTLEELPRGHSGWDKRRPHRPAHTRIKTE